MINALETKFKRYKDARYLETAMQVRRCSDEILSKINDILACDENNAPSIGTFDVFGAMVSQDREDKTSLELSVIFDTHDFHRDGYLILEKINEYKFQFFVCEKGTLSSNPQIPSEDYDEILHRLTMTNLRNAVEEYQGWTNAYNTPYLKSVMKQFDEVMNEVRVTLEDIGYSVTVVKDAFLIKQLCISWKNPFENYHNI